MRKRYGSVFEDPHNFSIPPERSTQPVLYPHNNPMEQGKKLKGIGKSARLEIEALLGTKVYLELWVKVKENWRDSDIALSNFGYKEQM